MKKKLKHFIPWLLFFIGVVTLLFIHQQKIFTIQHISCHVSDQVCPDYIGAELNKLQGHSIFFTDLDGAAARIVKISPSFSRFTIQKKLPNQVDLTFQASQQAYGLHFSNSPILIIDQAGVVITAVDQTSLPVIDVPQNFYTALQPSGVLDSSVHQSLWLLVRSIQAQHLDYKSLSLLDTPDHNDAQIILPDGKIAVVRLDQAPLELAQLALLLKSLDFTTIKTPVNVIDLRFKYPVLKASM